MPNFSPNRIFFLFTILSFAFTSCQHWNSEQVEVTYKNFGEEILEQQHLRFSFSHDLVSQDMTSDWSEEVYAEISPKVAGKFKWVLPNELLFSPDSGFAAATSYQIQFNDKLLQHLPQGKKYSLGSMAFQCRTPDLQLLQAKPFWATNDQKEAELRLELDFNYPVSIATLLPRLAIALGKLPFTYTLLTKETAKVIEVALHTDSLQNLDHQLLKVHIDPGVLLASDEAKETAELALEAEIPARSAFRINKVEATYLNTKPIIEVTASQSIGSENIQSFVTISPTVNFRVEEKANGFILEGNFREGETYELNIDKRLQGVFKVPLTNDFQQTVAFAKPEPSISFPASEALYLTSRGKRRLGVRLVSIDKVRLSIHKVYANNIKHFMEDNYLYSYIDRSDYSSLYNNGDEVLETVLETKDLQESNGLKLISLNFKNLNDYNGLYVVKVASMDDRWIADSKLVTISDIGLIVKQSKEELWVFANSILTAEPMTGANITVVSSNNQSLHTLPTNAKGFVKFPLKDFKSKGFEVGMITATRGNDFTYMSFNQNRHSTWDKYELNGYEPSSSGLQAYIYGERKLYRPGEKAHFNIIVRDESWQNPGNLPIKIKITSPSFDTYKEMKKTLNSEGSVEGSIEFPATAQTGNYDIQAYSSQGNLLGTYQISVEEFMPDRIKVIASLKNKPVLGQEAIVEGQALNLFGPPAGDRPLELSVSLEKKTLEPKGLEDYSFNMETDISYFPSIFLKKKTLPDGKIYAGFQISKEYAYNGLLQGSASVAVFDENGRPVYKTMSFDVPTQPVFYGIKKMESYIDGRQSIQIPIIAVNPEGKVFAEKKAHIEVIRYEWRNVLQRNYGTLEYVSHREAIKIADHEVNIKGFDYSYQLVPDLAGTYEVRVSEPGSSSYSYSKFYVYQGSGGVSNSFGIDKSGDIAISANATKYHVGDKAKVMFKMPFKGKLLVTVERDKVIKQYEFINTEERAEAFELPITEDMAPNAYITATLLKPVADDAIPLTAAYGFYSLSVEKPDTHLEMDIQAVEQSRSKERQTVTVKLLKPQAGVEVTIAAVDEGIHQIKGYKNPNPYDYFYQKRALTVRSYDLYPRVFPEYKIGERSYGADYYGDDVAKRINPLANNRVKPVSFWSGTLLTDKNGEVSYSFDVPAFSGRLRIVAVAAKGQAFGAAQGAMLVADPVVISAGLPRFASPQDALKVPVMLANTTEEAIEVETSITASGAASVKGKGTQTLRLAPNSQSTVFFEAQAARTIGQATIKIQAKGKGEVFEQSIELPVRPSTSLLKSSGAGIIKGNSTQTIDMKQDYLREGVDGRLVLSRSPSTSLAPHLKYLLEYPHGCLEQTISSAFPQLYLADLSKVLMQEKGIQQYQIDYHIQMSIQKLRGLQHYSGGFRYWPDGEVNWWASAYASHFLTEAKKAGYEVPEELLKSSLAYLSDQSLQDNQPKKVKAGTTPSPSVSNEKVYSLYVLALAGKPEVSLMNYTRNIATVLSSENQYLLACSYLLAGNKKAYQSLLPPAFTSTAATNKLGNDFSSPIRNMALSLNSIIDAEPTNAQIPLMAKKLSDAMSNETYLSTQERSFAVIALGKIAQAQSGQTVSASVTVDGNEVGSYNQGELTLRKNVVGESVKVQTKGTGDLYYFWELKGLNESGKFLEEDKGLKVRRTFFDREGKPLNPATLSQNDQVVVRVSVQSDGMEVSNVAITDMLPAGWEVENPRFHELDASKWIKDASLADHIDYRDDRINFFVTAKAKEQYYYYVARAVSKGTFQMGPISADAMYDGSYHSYHGARKVTVD